MADRAWDDADYPTDDELRNAARKLRDTAIGVRVGWELRLIPLGDPYASYVGKEAGGTPLVVNYTDPTGHTWSYSAQPGPDGRYSGTAEDWQAVESEFDWIEAFFTDRVLPEPNLVDSAIIQMANTATSLWNVTGGAEVHEDGTLPARPDDAMTEYFDAGGFIGAWEGAAGNKFRTQLWNLIPPTFHNQAALANAMSYNLTAYRDMLYQHRVDTRTLIDETAVALQSLAVHQSSWSINFSLIAAVATIAAGVAAMPITGGTSAAISATGAASLTILAGVSALPLSGADAATEGESQFNIDAVTVHGILRQVIDSTIELRNRFEDMERELADNLNGYFETMEAGGGSHDRFMMPRPAVIGESERVVDRYGLDTERFDSEIR